MLIDWLKSDQSPHCFGSSRQDDGTYTSPACDQPKAQRSSTRGALGRRWMFDSNIEHRCDRQRLEAQSWRHTVDCTTRARHLSAQWRKTGFSRLTTAPARRTQQQTETEQGRKKVKQSLRWRLKAIEAGVSGCTPHLLDAYNASRDVLYFFDSCGRLYLNVGVNRSFSTVKPCPNSLTSVSNSRSRISS